MGVLLVLHPPPVARREEVKEALVALAQGQKLAPVQEVHAGVALGHHRAQRTFLIQQQRYTAVALATPGIFHHAAVLLAVAEKRFILALDDDVEPAQFRFILQVNGGLARVAHLLQALGHLRQHVVGQQVERSYGAQENEFIGHGRRD